MNTMSLEQLAEVEAGIAQFRVALRELEDSNLGAATEELLTLQQLLVSEVRRLSGIIEESKRTLRWRKWKNANNYDLSFDGFESDPIATIYDVDGLESHWTCVYDDGYCSKPREAMTEAEKSIPDIRPIDTIIRPEVGK